MKIYIGKNGEQQGPYSIEEINALAQSATITGDDVCWYKGCAEWIPLSQLPGFIPAQPPRSVSQSMPQANQLSSVSTATTSFRSDVIGYVMLIIPVIAALLIWQSGNLGLPAMPLSFIAIIATAILGGVEAKQLGMGSDSDKNANGKRQSGPGSWAAVILLLWVIGFPAYIYTRKRYGTRNLLLSAVIVTLAFCAAPFVAAPELPSVDAPEIVQLAERAIRESPAIKLSGGLIGTITISNPGEISYDKRQQKRVARAELKTNLGSEVIYYTVEWQNRDKGIIWVQIQAHP